MTSVSGAYLAQLLRDRGYPVPANSMVRAYVDALPREDLPGLVALVRVLSLGTEATHDVTALIERIKACPSPNAAKPSRQDIRSQDRAFPDSRKADQAEVNMLRQHGLHAYAKAGAVKIELDLLPNGRDEVKRYTVRLDGARGEAGAYDWERKIIFQFTQRELPTLAAFLLGFVECRVFEARNHGRSGNKSLKLEDQGTHVFLRLSEPGGALVTIPVAPAEVFGFAEIVLTALALNRPLVAPAAILTLVRRVGAMA